MKKLVAMVSLYESGDWVENRIENLLQCDCINDMEIWCVNANSPDQRDDIIPQKYPVKYVKLPERISVYETWNYIISNSDSQYVTQANTDDIVSPECYTMLMSVLDKNQEYGFAYCSWYATHIPNQKWKELTAADPNRAGGYDGHIDRNGIGHFPLWRRSLHTKLGLFDTQFQALADAEWWARCFWLGQTRFYWVDKFLACYLWRNGQNLWHRKISPEEWKRYHEKVNSFK